MTVADKLNQNQSEMEDEMTRHEKEMARLISVHDGLIGEHEQELQEVQTEAHDAGYQAGYEAEREPNR
jgi:hypothetical protein